MARARQDLATAQSEHRQHLEQRDTELAQAREQANTAQLDAAAARAAQQGAQEQAARERLAAEQLRGELDQTRQQLHAELDTARESVRQAAADTAALRLQLATLSAEAEAAGRTAHADREALAALRGELEQLRGEARAERQALRAAHAEQLAQVQRTADDRAAALNQALTLAREAADTYRTQLTETRSTTGQPTTTRKRPPQ